LDLPELKETKPMKLCAVTISRVIIAASLCTFAVSNRPSVANAQAPEVPPKAASVEGTLPHITLSPPFSERFLCVDHSFGELEYAGDALGTDCVISGGVEIGRDGFLKLYRTDGTTNVDWYGWHAEVLAPFDGTIAYVFDNKDENVPGKLGSSPAGSIKFRSEDGVIVIFAHITDIKVKAGDKVTAGQSVAKLGNNGQTRAPGLHVGAYRERGVVPLQIIWDLRAMGKLRGAAGVK
jgi:peptidase M23-like protein